jgi:hypothetical protein
LAGLPGPAQFLLVRYEDLLSDPMPQLGRIARFIEIEASTELLASATERSSAQRMRVLERTQGSQWITTRDKRQDIPFVGAASIGGWKERLSTASIAEIEAAWGPLMVQLGYNLLTARDGNLGVSVPNRATGLCTMGNDGPRARLSHPAAVS